MTTQPAYTTDPAYALAGFVANLTYDRLPAAVISNIKRIILDVTGTALAGSSLGAGCREFVQVVAGFGGAPEATVLAHGIKVPAVHAALLNGAISHALNFDDVFPGGGHLGVVTLPAAYALAERLGGVDGREFLTALAAGGEVAARLQLAVRGADDGTSEAKPQPTQFLGAFAAAATCARLLHLDQTATLSALGHALMQASGNRQPVVQGTTAKALYAAYPNFHGLFSALLAQAGIGAACSVLEGEAGLFPTAYSNRYVASCLTDHLGDRFEMEAVAFKPWPTTGRAHVYIEAALDIANTETFATGDIEEVVVRGAPYIRTFSEPIEMRRHPRTSIEAEDNVFYGPAKALVNRAVVLRDFQPEGLGQPDVDALGSRMRYEIDAELKGVGVLQVRLADGRVLGRRVSQPLGSPGNPLSDAQLLAKFYDCATHAIQPIPGARLDRFVELAAHAEQVDAVELVRALHP